jgi:23S rRNA pseudouridine2605 synthase
MTGPAHAHTPQRHGLARVLSRLGTCSRSQAERMIREGRVTVAGRRVLDPQRPTDPRLESIRIDGIAVQAAAPVHIALNKPRGLVTSAADERDRATVYSVLAEAGLPWLGPVGRLDKASEGLLLLSNDTAWSARITDPATHVPKTYHVQVRGVPDADVLARMRAGVTDAGERLAAQSVALLRSGGRTAWLEVVLDEGRNRHIRRLLSALGFDVQRLIRVAIGPLVLGDLAKGQWRHLTPCEIDALSPTAGRSCGPRG